ncbi:MAG: prepilin-type N-terminal cleavage/methylation domain-containing protein [Candidatus Pacebacteria bacterium]|nr:prepilin-type N-terminal cleavage/methylation domain-containing protein [Candidatus Paceibacterota bacterium]
MEDYYNTNKQKSLPLIELLVVIAIIGILAIIIVISMEELRIMLGMRWGR